MGTRISNGADLANLRGRCTSSVEFLCGSRLAIQGVGNGWGKRSLSRAFKLYPIA
jgi:hypothetical protein